MSVGPGETQWWPGRPPGKTLPCQLGAGPAADPAPPGGQGGGDGAREGGPGDGGCEVGEGIDAPGGGWSSGQLTA